MVFAAQKLAKRHGTGTIFKSRGRERTETDVAHYWKRKKEKPEDFSPLATTPDGLEYWTAPPTPNDTMDSMTLPPDVLMSDGIELDCHHDSTLSARRPPRVIDMSDDTENYASSSPNEVLSLDTDDLLLFKNYGTSPGRSPSPTAIEMAFLRAAFCGMASDYLSTIIEPLDSPETLKRQEAVINCSREYFLWWIGTVYRTVTGDLGWTNKGIVDFELAGLNLMVGIHCGSSKEDIEIMFLDTIARLPSAMQQERPQCMFAIIKLIAQAATRGPRAVSFTQRIRDRALDQGSRMWGKESPFAQLLMAIGGTETNHFQLCNVVLAGKDILSTALGQRHHYVRWLLTTLAEIVLDRPTEELRYRKEIYQHDLAFNQADITEMTLITHVENQSHLAVTHSRLGNFDEADVLLQDGVWKLEGIHDPLLQSLARVDLLLCTGNVMARSGQMRGARKSFNEARSILQSIHPTSSGCAPR